MTTVHKDWDDVPFEAIFIISGGDGPDAVWTRKYQAEQDFGSHTYIDIFEPLGGRNPIFQFWIDGDDVMQVKF